MSILTMEIDCHDHPYEVEDECYPECGPQCLVGFAETYAILIERLPDHPWDGWAWMYRITGPREHLVRFLAEEYTSGVPEAQEMVDAMAEEVPR